MAGQIADGVYNRRAWSAPTADLEKAEVQLPPQNYLGPFQSNAERLVGQALATWSMSSEEIQQYVRPPLPQLQMFPARYGYTENEIGVEDLINLPRRVATTQRTESDFSQTPNTQESSSRNTLGNV